MKNNPFVYSNDNKRYHTLSYYNKNKYGGKVYKAVLDCGFTCPNIDGKKGYEGCIFCDSGSGYFTKGNLDIRSQLDAEIERISRKSSGEIRIIAYFQSNTNTYAPVGQLRRLYEMVLENEHVCGISIGTRADCLSEDVLDLLTELNGKTNLTVELGLQSVHEATINYINRCCTHEKFLDGYNRLKSAGIRTCLHIINGLPKETPEMMMETAYQASLMKPDAVKIQMLHIINDTLLAKIYKFSPFKLITKDEYIEITVRQLEFFSPETVIERITGDGDRSKLIAPLWTTDKISVLGGIDKLQACRNS